MSGSATRGYGMLTADHISWLGARVAPAAMQTQTQLWVDPVNGKENASGKTAGTGVKTVAEACRRIRSYRLTTPGLDVRLASYPPSGTDPMQLDIESAQLGSTLTPIFNFYGPAYTQVGVGTMTAVTTRSGNVPNEFTDGAVVTTGQEGYRLRISGGARVGAKTWVALSTGSGKRRTGEWIITDPVNFFSTKLVPQVGDPYVIEKAPGACMLDYVRMRAGGNNGFSTGFWPMVLFHGFDFALPNGATGLLSNDGGGIIGYFDTNFGSGVGSVAVHSPSPMAYGTGGYQYFPNCYCQQGFNVGRGGVGENYIEAGVWGGVQVFGPAGLSVDLDALAQRNGAIHAIWGALNGGRLLIYAAGSMDSHGSGDGAPFLVQDDGEIIIAGAGFSLYGSPGRIWGSSANGGSYGLSVRDKGVVRYNDGTQLTVTGASGDFRMGSQQTAYGFQAGGTYTAAIATTWNNLRTTLLDNAHYPQTRSSIFKSSALTSPR